MTPWTIAVPSFGRAGRVTTDKVFHGAVVVVPESQADLYMAHPLENEGRYQPMPDRYEGNIAKKRNWILDNLGDRIVMADDDYDHLGMVERGEMHKLDWPSIASLLLNGFQMVEDLGTVLWGVNLQVDPRFYREYSPFSLLSPILGPFAAFDRCTLRYDEDLWLKEDYDLSLQVLRKHHKALRFNKYHYSVDHFSEAGGIVGMRNMPEEVRQLRRLQEKWGSEVVAFDLTRSVNPRVRVPLRGI